MIQAWCKRWLANNGVWSNGIIRLRLLAAAVGIGIDGVGFIRRPVEDKKT